MSYEQETKLKIKLAQISHEIDMLVAKHLDDLTVSDIQYIIDNYSKYLTYDLKRNFSDAREKNLKESPFDSIINDDLGINNE